jgi:hypothetical protein
MNPVHNLISWRSSFILPITYCLGLLSGLFPSCLPTKILYVHLLSHGCYLSCPNHLDLIPLMSGKNTNYKAFHYAHFSSPLFSSTEGRFTLIQACIWLTGMLHASTLWSLKFKYVHFLGKHTCSNSSCKSIVNGVNLDVAFIWNVQCKQGVLS